MVLAGRVIREKSGTKKAGMRACAMPAWGALQLAFTTYYNPLLQPAHAQILDDDVIVDAVVRAFTT